MDPRIWHRSYDDGVPPDVDADGMTLCAHLERAAAAHGDRPALVFANRTLRYRVLKDQVDRLATALAGLGVGRGARVAVHAPNVPQMVIGYYAVQALGAIAVPTNPLYTPREIEHQWNDAGCDVAIVMDFIFDQRIRKIRDRLPVRHYVVASIPEYLGWPLAPLAAVALRRRRPPLAAPVPREPGVHRFRKLIAATPPAPPRVTVDADDVSTLLYTGGTTGLSKGAMLTHRNLSCNIRQLRAWFPAIEPGREVVLGALPLFHSFGLTVVMNLGISVAAAVVLVPDPRDISAIVKAIARHRATLFPAVPAQFAALTQLAGVGRLDLSSIKACLSGAAPLPVEVLERFEQLTGSRISEGYGLTETSPVVYSNPLFRRRKVGSIGVPLPGTDGRIVDAQAGGRDLPSGEVGELAVKGPQVMQGYWRRPDETARILRDGWLYTGDLARIDEDGFAYIEGRKKDMILCSGYNVYPDEIDRVLTAHPAVLEAATIGLPDPKRGETVKSFVVLRAGVGASADEILDHARESLAAYKVPREIEFRAELPKSSVLKILRRELRDEEMKRRAGEGARRA